MLETGETIEDLKPVGILSHVVPGDLETLKYYGVFGEYGEGDILIEEGSIQDRLYIIINGELEVSVKSSGEKVVLGIIGGGDSLGEVSIFEPGAASATVEVLRSTILWHTDVDSLQSFFEQLPVAGGQLMLGISQLLSKRLRQANSQIIQNHLPPQHMMVRAGRKEPLRADNIKPADKQGFLGSLFGKK